MLCSFFISSHMGPWVTWVTLYINKINKKNIWVLNILKDQILEIQKKAWK